MNKYIKFPLAILFLLSALFLPSSEVLAAGVLTSVSITDPTAGTISPGSVEVGVPTQLTANPLDDVGAVFTGATFAWSSNNTAVATIDANGLATGLTAGSAIFTVVATDPATSASVQGTLNLNFFVVPVFPVATTTIAITPLTANVAVGASQQFTPTVLILNSNQPPIDITSMATIVWSSSDTNIGTINSSGLFTAVSAGNTIITASSGGATATANVSVFVPAGQPVLTSVSIINPNVGGMIPENVTAGTTAQFTGAPLDQFGVSFVGANINWSSNNNSVATISANGLLTAVYPGTVIITAAATDGELTVQNTLSVTVDAPFAPGPAANIILSRTSLNLVVGQGWGITAKAVDQYGTQIVLSPGSSLVFTWTTSNSNAASVVPYTDSSSAYVSAKAAGTSTITVSTGGISASLLVNVADKPACVNSINVSPAMASTTIGNTRQLTATALDQYGAIFSGATIYWLNSNPSIASVSSNGLITGILPGQTAVTSMANGCYGVVYGNGATITVFPAPGTFSITSSATGSGSITPLGYSGVVAGNSQTYIITPNANSHIADVLVDGVSVGAVSTYTFANVQANHTISASFTAVTFNITASAGANGSISPGATSTINAGTNFTYAINPNAGYSVADVLVDGVSVGAVSTYTFTNVQANHTISASFSLSAPTLTLFAGWNLVSWPGVTPIIAGNIPTLYAGVTVVSKFNNATQIWTNFITGNPLNNFTVNPNDVLFVRK